MKKYRITTKRSLIIRMAASIMRKKMGHQEVINLNDQPMPDQYILLGTHNGLRGPFVYQSFLPDFCVPWGTHEMTGKFKERWNYLYHVFYQQKLHFSPRKAWFKATLLAPISRIFYNKIGLIGTYPDGRQISAIKRSIAHLEKNVPIMLFPENSSKGYFEVLTECHSGFVILANSYYKKHGIDLPIYPSYYSSQHKRIIIDKPIFVRQLMAQGLDRMQIAEHTKLLINNLQESYNAKLAEQDNIEQPTE